MYSVGFIDWCVDFVRLSGIVSLCYWPNGLRKLVVVLKRDYYKFGCLVNVVSCGLVGDTEIV